MQKNFYGIISVNLECYVWPLFIELIWLPSHYLLSAFLITLRPKFLSRDPLGPRLGITALGELSIPIRHSKSIFVAHLLELHTIWTRYMHQCTIL